MFRKSSLKELKKPTKKNKQTNPKPHPQKPPPKKPPPKKHNTQTTPKHISGTSLLNI